jgi:hypothetical protein
MYTVQEIRGRLAFQPANISPPSRVHPWLCRPPMSSAFPPTETRLNISACTLNREFGAHVHFSQQTCPRHLEFTPGCADRRYREFGTDMQLPPAPILQRHPPKRHPGTTRVINSQRERGVEVVGSRRQTILQQLREGPSLLRRVACPICEMTPTLHHLCKIQVITESTSISGTALCVKKHTSGKFLCVLRTSINGTALSGKKPINGRFLCVFTRSTGRMCND